MTPTHLWVLGRPACSPDPAQVVLGLVVDQPDRVTCPACHETPEWNGAVAAQDDDAWMEALGCQGVRGGRPCGEAAIWFSVDGSGLCGICVMREEQATNVLRVRQVLTECLEQLHTLESLELVLNDLLFELGGPVEEGELP